MSENVVGTVVGVTVGVVATVLTQRVIQEYRKVEQETLLEEAELAGYKRGYDYATQTPNVVKRAYRALFEEKEEGK